MEVQVGVTIFGSGIEIPEMEHIEVIKDLTPDQIRQLLGLLREDALDDHDAEFILNILKFHDTALADYIPVLLTRFPSLSKSVFSSLSNKDFAPAITNAQLSVVIYEFLEQAQNVSEFQLFWLATIAENRLAKTEHFGKILHKIFELSAGSIIAQAKILEIPDQKYGLKDYREEHLKNGSSNWLSWASAMGSRTLKKGERNYVLDYFSKGSPLNFLISSCIKEMP